MGQVLQLDGLVGMTYHFGGLSEGNLASKRFEGTMPNPKKAALQGLAKMKQVMALGIPQAVLLPPPRPNLEYLRSLGFRGSDTQLLAAAYHHNPKALSIALSATTMWAANAATVSPKWDTSDGKTHLTIANLVSTAHRSLEPVWTEKMMRHLFSEARRFQVHSPLNTDSPDEGAANHIQFSPEPGAPGIELFVYGKTNTSDSGAKRFPARQSLAACHQIAARHRLSPDQVVFAKQSPLAIDGGVFHNDVIAMGFGHLLIVHEHAFADTTAVCKEIGQKMAAISGKTFMPIIVLSDQLSLSEAVETYFFNSQIIAPSTNEWVVLAPEQCERHPKARQLFDDLLAADNPITAIRYVALGYSMKNGGGPACLRLQVPCDEVDLAAITSLCVLNSARHRQLVQFVEDYYPNKWILSDVLHPDFLTRCQTIHGNLLAMFGIQ